VPTLSCKLGGAAAVALSQSPQQTRATTQNWIQARRKFIDQLHSKEAQPPGANRTQYRLSFIEDPLGDYSECRARPRPGTPPIATIDRGGPGPAEGARAGAGETTKAGVGVMTWRRGAEAMVLAGADAKT
jgi:hypothetical protein